MALTFTPTPKPGECCPDFTLPGVDGRTYSHDHFFKGTPVLVVFMCNHCPYVQAIEDRLITLAQDLKKLNIPMVAICSNDSTEYPEDSFENLKKRSIEKSYPFSYLHDESQAVALRFGAVCTPDFFLFDKNRLLQYRGRLDDSWKDPKKVTKRELYEATIALLSGTPTTAPQIPSMGCSIKWKDSVP